MHVTPKKLQRRKTTWWGVGDLDSWKHPSAKIYVCLCRCRIHATTHNSYITCSRWDTQFCPAEPWALFVISLAQLLVLRQFINEWKWKQILQCHDNLFMKGKKTLAHRWLWKLLRFELGCLYGTAKLGPFFVWYPSPLPTYCVEHLWMELCCAFEAWFWKAAKQKWVQLAARCATASSMQRLWSPRTNSIKMVGFETRNFVHFVILRLKRTHSFGWHDEYRGGYLSLFNKMPSFAGLSTIAHGWLAKMNAFQKLAGKQREPWVFNAQPILVKIEPVW